MEKLLKFNYDYSRCMVMKLAMAFPEKNIPGKSHVLMTFEEALFYIKRIDNMTPGITKIYYLVGWQYLGHDDKYPDFFEVNEALKRPQDKTAYDSFKWLSDEAKKYHSVISVHINFNDAYDNAPSFQDFVKAGALIRKKNGQIHAIEKYNGKKCYKICHKTYWESGLFKRQFDRFMETFPFIAETGTIHVDNFQCYKNYAPYVSMTQMQDARRKMIEYVKTKGIDITSEFTYKETESLPNKPIFGLPREHHKSAPMDTVGMIAMSWWCNHITKQELIDFHPQIYCGGEFREKKWNRIFYGNMHGEDIIRKDNPDWADDFLYRFATYQVPFHFLCTHKRLAFKGHFKSERCEFSDGIISCRHRSRIKQNGEVLKEKDDLFIPYIHEENSYFAYSKNGFSGYRKVSRANTTASVFEITPDGLRAMGQVEIKNFKIVLSVQPKQALLVQIDNAAD
ncbi:MAG: endo-alpha-N-acetylgalactosaminidase family protein [Acutalibacteraceae bacterium]